MSFSMLIGICGVSTTVSTSSSEKSPAGLKEFSTVICGAEDNEKRYEVIYCCEYLGFLDAEERRVGCLLHPFGNGGEDLRDVSFYGRELCDGHFCPSYHYLSAEEKMALLHICDDWYLYGLVVTDIDLVKSYFRWISDGIYETPSPDVFRKDALRETARRFFDLKVTWPFRSLDIHRLGKYYFDGSQYMIQYIDYEALGHKPSRFDKIFLSLSSVFQDRREIVEAEAIIQSHIDGFIQEYRLGRELGSEGAYSIFC